MTFDQADIPTLYSEAPPLAAGRRYGSPPKILLYSHDTFGIGNIRRTLIIAQELRKHYENASILIITGSPVIHAFRVPDGVDYVKLPCLDRIDVDRYEPRFLRAFSKEVKHTRKAILKSAVLGFDPDLMMVDKRPSGVDGELLETLQALRAKRRATKLVLGMRDILDEPEATRRSLRRAGSFETIARYYDEVWIYGMKEIFDAVKEYQFPDVVARKTHYCGYLKRPTVTVQRKQGPPQVLVTTGGGGDGSEITEAYLEGLVELPRRLVLQTTVVFGPQMPDTRRTALLERFGHLPDVTFLDFEPDLTRCYAEADVVVSMAGYNAVCELLSFRRHAVLVPRAKPVKEQLLRTRRLFSRNYFAVVEPQDLTAANLIAKVLAALRQTTTPPQSMDLDGLPTIRERVRVLLKERAK